MGYFKNLDIERHEVERTQAQMYGDTVNRDSVPAVMESYRGRLTPAERIEVLEDVIDYELWGQLMSTNIIMKQAIYG